MCTRKYQNFEMYGLTGRGIRQVVRCRQEAAAFRKNIASTACGAVGCIFSVARKLFQMDASEIATVSRNIQTTRHLRITRLTVPRYSASIKAVELLRWPPLVLHLVFAWLRTTYRVPVWVRCELKRF